jgi:hypothetical protein
MNLHRCATRSLIATILLCCVAVKSLAQSPANADAPTGDVVLTKLAEPSYPPLARQTFITGDVELTLEIRPDGSVQSATAVRGHPLLRQTAIDSAQHSQFACQKCSSTITLSWVYTFLLVGDPRCCPPEESASKQAQTELPSRQVVQSQAHVTLIDTMPPCFCDGSILGMKVRSLKCLYIWRCAYR